MIIYSTTRHLYKQHLSTVLLLSLPRAPSTSSRTVQPKRHFPPSLPSDLLAASSILAVIFSPQLASNSDDGPHRSPFCTLLICPSLNRGEVRRQRDAAYMATPKTTLVTMRTYWAYECTGHNLNSVSPC